ncbi:hypothetical protein N8860_09160 [Alphaproteobacteria bacterium]|nr:hypothetical protein [Alphaproteobacteria bacterium]
MAIEEGLRGIKVTSENDKDNHHIHIRYCTRDVHNPLSAKAAFLYSTPIAKSIRTSNPV